MDVTVTPWHVEAIFSSFVVVVNNPIRVATGVVVFIVVLLCVNKYLTSKNY